MMTFEKQKTFKGSNFIQWNVSLNGKPFGAITTFKDDATDQHPWLVKPLNGEYKWFWGEWKKPATKAKALEAAKTHMESLA